MSWTPERLLAYLDELGIETTTVTHPPVFTVEEAKRLRGPLPGGHCKSLFLRNKKGAMWLVVVFEQRRIDLRRLGESLGIGRLGFASHERLDRLPTLSGRELEILGLLAEELSNKAIARQLFISTGTVKRHAHNIYGKLSVGNRRSAVRKAQALGIL